MEFEVMPRIPVGTKNSTKTTTTTTTTTTTKTIPTSKLSTTPSTMTTTLDPAVMTANNPNRLRPFYELRPQKLIPTIRTEHIPNVDHTRKISTESSSNGNQSINASPSPPSPTSSSLPSPLTVNSTISPQYSNLDQIGDHPDNYIETTVPNTTAIINGNNTIDNDDNHHLHNKIMEINSNNSFNYQLNTFVVDHNIQDNGKNQINNNNLNLIASSSSHTHSVVIEDFEEEDPLFVHSTHTHTNNIGQAEILRSPNLHHNQQQQQQEQVEKQQQGQRQKIANFTTHKFHSTTAINDRRPTDTSRPLLAQRSNSLMPRTNIRHSTFNIPQRNSQIHMIDKDNNPIASEVEKWRNSIISKRELKKKRKELLEDGRVLVGNKVSEGHSNYTMAYNMLTGIRVSVSRVSGIRKPLTDLDFSMTKKLAFDVSGSELTPSSKYDFKFKDYSPTVFRELRLIFGLDPADYLVSLTSKYILSELGSPGKSGSFFYYSRDYRFIIKTIHHSEHRQLRAILKDYYHYVKENPNTLISQFYGLHRLKMRVNGRPKKVHFLVMNNLFPAKPIHRQYDLKGSTDGRYTRKDNSKSPKKMVVYKDLNWLEDGYGLKLKSPDKQKLVNQLKKDVRLLQKLNIMDYSMLIGVHDCHLDPKPNEDYDPEEDERGFYQCLKSDDDGYIYYIGVIDCLTRYSTMKRLETLMRRLERSKNFSCINSKDYGNRFMNFMESNVFKKDKVD